MITHSPVLRRASIGSVTWPGLNVTWRHARRAATMHPAGHVPAGIRQLLGYLLIDYTDQHSLTAIGIYLARQGELLAWKLRELLPRLGATTPLDVLRNCCMETLQRH